MTLQKWACVIGSPIDHSLSPVLHRRAYQLAGIDWEYHRFEVDEANLAEFMRDLPAECQGISVTMPCKIKIASHLDNVDGLAKAVGAVNTVVCGGGLRSGFNTDVQGIVGALVRASNTGASATQLAPVQPSAADTRLRAVILGTGATAASALTALAQMGIREVSVVGRRFGVQTALGLAATRLNLTYQPVNWRTLETVTNEIDRATVVVSTVPPQVAAVAAEGITVNPEQVFLDVTYTREARPLTQAFSGGGARVASPLDMLIYQGLAQVKLMTGHEVPFEPVSETVQAAADESAAS